MLPLGTVEWDDEKARILAESLRDPESRESKELKVRIDAYVKEHQPLIDAILEGNRISDDAWRVVYK
jgi:hypothetical protein